MKINFKKIAFFNLIVSSIFTSTLIFGINTSNNTNDNNVNLNSLYSSSTYDWNSGGSGSSDEVQANFDFKDETEINNSTYFSNFTPKKANEFTSRDVKEFIKITSGSPNNWYVKILDLTDDDIKKGIIKFEVIQNLKKADGSYQEVKIQKNSNTTWSTESASYLKKFIISSKYKFEWISDSELKRFFESNEYTANQIDENIVKRNLISYKSILPTNYSIKLENVSGISSDFGVKKISIDFSSSSTNANDWESGSVPSKQEIILRGLKPIGTNRNDMYLEFIKDNIGSIEISDKSMFGNALSDSPNDKPTLSELLPSEFSNVIETSESSTVLHQMLTEGLGLNNKPFVEIMYMGKKTADSDFNNSTGLKSSDYKIKKIRTIPNDLDGSLKIVYTFSCIDIYSNKTIDKEVIQDIPADTFKRSSDAGKILNLEWLSINELPTIGTAYEVVNNIKKNISNKNYIKKYTNQFFYGTQETYDQDREILISYNGGTIEESGNFLPVESEEKVVEITLIFPNWAGATYIDENNELKQGYKTTVVYEFPSYKVDQISINWVDVDKFISNNSTFKYIAPSTIVSKIISKEYKDDIFFKVDGDLSEFNVSKTYIPDDYEGTISVNIWISTEATNTNGEIKTETIGYFNQVFTGMKQDRFMTSSVVEFSWVPAIEISQRLLSIPIDEVTKQDVIDLYLNEIPLFANKSLTENNVDMDVVYDENKKSKVLNLYVSIPMFGQNNPNMDDLERVFYTSIFGFASNEYESANDLTGPADLTALYSLLVSAGVGSLLLIILIIMITNRSRVRTFKNNNSKKNKK